MAILCSAQDTKINDIRNNEADKFIDREKRSRHVFIKNDLTKINHENSKSSCHCFKR